MLVKEILQLCDKNMEINIDMYNGAADYVAEKFLELNGIEMKAYELLNAHRQGIQLMSPNQRDSDRATKLKTAQSIVVNSKINNVNKLINEGGSIEMFGKLEVEYLDEINDVFTIHVKEI